MRHTRLTAGLLAIVIAASSCAIGGDDGDPLEALRPETPDGEIATADDSDVPSSVLEEQSDDPVVLEDHDLVVDLAGEGAPFDRRLLGSNLPAWVGQRRDSQEWFYPALEASGVEVVRMPGGSWSNRYSWLGCLEETPDCRWLWAADTGDLLRMMDELDLTYVWTVEFNGTAKEAAALVAFFNAEVGDTTEIGVDEEGQDWRTAGDWAALRTELGHPDPVRVDYWEIGNEIYGARPSTAGNDCAEFGWEHVSTCDGTEYILGFDGQAGYLEFAEEMKAIDPDIEIGAVGVAPADSWQNFGNEVLAHAGDAIDFYIVHHYGFFRSPETEEALDRPLEYWPTTMSELRDAFAGWGVEGIPVAITEYNLVSFQDGDTEGSMAQALNAFFIAESIGQMALQGVELATHWNLFNGAWGPGATNYGLFALDGTVVPQFFAMRLWSMMGDTLRATQAIPGLRTYATTAADGSVQIMVMNPTSETLELDIALEGGGEAWDAIADVMVADDLSSRVVSYNNGPGGRAESLQADPIALGGVEANFTHSFEPVSITVLRLTPA